MKRKNANEFPQEVLTLFDGYVHGAISRRAFLDRAQKFAVGGMTAAVMLESLRPNYAFAAQVAKDDARILAGYTSYPSLQGTGTVRGYLAQPVDASKKYPGVVVIHENRGLNPYIEDVARRLALEGFIAFAPDALTPLGGYPGDEEKAVALFSKLDNDKRTEDLVAAAGYVKALPGCTGKYGAVGFCFGGGMVNTFAVRLPDLGAGVAFYGGQPPVESVSRIKAPLMLHYAGLDTRINAGWPAYEAALKVNGVGYEAYVYEGVNHGFHNDTTPRYDDVSAKRAWHRTVDFFNKNLRGA
jgi:carboxymethylenebutenolidase